MARGYPAVLSAVFALPFYLVGGYLYLLQWSDLSLPGVTIPATDLQLLAVPFGVFAVFVTAGGLYVQFVAAPSAPRLLPDETIVAIRQPSQRVAFSKIALSAPILGISGYLFFFTLMPYVYPTVALVIGLYFFSTGLKTYWTNILTSYYVTTRRVLREYRFISLTRQEIPLNKVRAVEERRSVIESLVRLGNVQVASGGGGGSVRLPIRNIGESTEFADEIRALLT